jgi:hypothetical protein
MARNNGRNGRNNNPSSRNQYSDWGVMDMVRERPVAAAAAVASAAAAGLFLWSKRTRISNQLSSLSDQIGEWSLSLGSHDDTGGTTTTTPSGPSSSTGSQRETRETASGNASRGRSSGGAGSGGTPSGRGRARSTAATEQ